MKISATIITLNEEVHLAQCLESIRDIADELIIVDSGSHDKTREIAESHGARFLVRPWTNYSDQKNFASAQTTHDWILSLDADECLSLGLREALLDLKQKPGAAAAYSFPRRAFYLGRWIDHSGWYPDYKTRLYHRGMARWVGEFVHERLVVDGATLRVKADLLHYTCQSVGAHAQSLDRYTSLAAQDLYARGVRCSLFRLLGSSSGAFFKSYFLKVGFRDGIQGCLIAWFAAYYNFLKYAKLWELERQGENSPPRFRH
jgi:glycosyltransferase involved in cell wall biosynthesis